MQNNCVVLITKHQSLKVCQHFLLFNLFSFIQFIYGSVNFHYQKVCVMCCVRRVLK